MSDIFEWKVYDPPMPVTNPLDEYSWDIVGEWEIPTSIWRRDIMRRAHEMFAVVS